jgi:hypothetical protein
MLALDGLLASFLAGIFDAISKRDLETGFNRIQ